MKLHVLALLTFHFLCAAQLKASSSPLLGIVILQEAITAGDLRKKGIEIIKLKNADGPPASFTVTITVDKKASFESTTFFVLKEEIFSDENLLLKDWNAHEISARKVKTKDREVSIMVFGKEDKCSYARIEVLADSKSSMACHLRYLVRISEIPESSEM